jgi:hypothetical protein
MLMSGKLRVEQSFRGVLLLYLQNMTQRRNAIDTVDISISTCVFRALKIVDKTSPLKIVGARGWNYTGRERLQRKQVCVVTRISGAISEAPNPSPPPPCYTLYEYIPLYLITNGYLILEIFGPWVFPSRAPHAILTFPDSYRTFLVIRAFINRPGALGCEDSGDRESPAAHPDGNGGREGRRPTPTGAAAESAAGHSYESGGREERQGPMFE